MENIFIIGFAGKNNVGKSTIRNGVSIAILQDKQFRQNNIHTKNTSFAHSLKECARKYFFWDGKKDQRGRRLLQTLGTEVGRWYDPEI